MKTALITGITGQDGSYLAEFLLNKGYAVHGIKRRSSSLNTERIDHIYEDPNFNNTSFHLHYGDLSDSSNLTRIIKEVNPDEVYNLAAQSHVAVSFEAPEYTADVDALGTLRILEAIRLIHGSFLLNRQPQTTSKSLIFSRSSGMSAGLFCMSASRVTKYFPRATLKPAAKAADCPWLFPN